jgi:hypothetical protein
MRLLYIPSWLADTLRNAEQPLSVLLNPAEITKYVSRSDLIQVYSATSFFDHYIYHKGFSDAVRHEYSYSPGNVNHAAEQNYLSDSSANSCTLVHPSGVRSEINRVYAHAINRAFNVPLYFGGMLVDTPYYNDFIVADKRLHHEYEDVFNYEPHFRGGARFVANLFKLLTADVVGFNLDTDTFYYDIVQLSADTFGIVPKRKLREADGGVVKHVSLFDMEKVSFALLVDELTRLSYVHKPSLSALHEVEMLSLWIEQLPLVSQLSA